jgi:ABC-type multidrug transport system fused ATPase/permease subunit
VTVSTPAVREAVPAEQESGPFGPISAEKVSLSYPGSERVALRDVSLRIDPGEVVALVGAIGRIGELFGDVLSEGRVVEAGTHEELMNAPGTYAELFSLQARPYQ